MKLLRHILLPSLAAAAMATPAVADPALWKVSDADSDIYLFGSVHLFTREMNWRTSQFDDLLKTADHVYFEVVMDVDAYATVTYLTMTEGTYRGDGEALSAILGDDEWDRLAAAADQVGLDSATFHNMKPWLAAMTLSQAATPKATAGVELIIDSEIEKDRKRGLETAREQMAFFTDIPVNEQIDGLMSTIEGIETGALAQLDPLVDAWESGDTDALKSAMDVFVTPRDKAAYAKLIDDRNRRWVGPLEELLASNDESLVIVGAAHLVGPVGVPALLEKKGYAVERIDAPTESGSHIEHPRR